MPNNLPFAAHTETQHRPTLPAKNDPETDSIVNDLRFRRSHSLVAIGVPSHERDGTPLAEGRQSTATANAMAMFADLFGGATAMTSCRGVFKSSAGTYIWDDLILVEAFTETHKLEQPKMVSRVLDLARKMMIELNQESVMVVFDNVVRFVRSRGE